MKKVLLFGLLLMATGVVKAQNQSLKLNQPFSTKDLGIQIDTIPPTITNKAPNLSQLQNDKLTNLLAAKRNTANRVYDEIFYSTMPVAGASSSNSNMPVAKSGNSNAKYTMPVKRIDIVNPTKNKSAVTNP